MDTAIPAITPKKLALIFNHFTGWGGAVDFMRFILEGAAGNSKLFDEADVLVRRRSLSKLVKEAIKQKTLRPQRAIDPYQVTEDITAGTGRMKVAYFAKKKLKEAVEKLGIDVLMPSTVPLGKNFPIPWTGVIFDFQHKYYPDFFSEEVLTWRDRSFSAILDEAPLVIVNSRSVASDAAKFLPRYAHKVHALPFAPLLRPVWLTYDPEPVRAKYTIAKRYFIICNQFFVHKDHETAFVAMRKLLDSVPDADAELVCTGTLEDSRRPGYIPYLQKRIEGLGLTGRVKLLGHIPKRDQIALLRGSCALVQPTLFEGDPAAGSGYEAIALGVPLIASDIPVNLEITDEPNVFFFKAQNPDQLSAHMKTALEPIVQPSHEELIQKSNKRRQMLCAALYEAAQKATRNFKSRGEADAKARSKEFLVSQDR